MIFSIDAIAAACQDARIIVPAKPGVKATGISWDSRSIHPGDLYISIPGERVDGNDYVSAAVQAGAACALMTRMPSQSEKKCAQEKGAGIILCHDYSSAITDLARTWRGQLSGCVIGITGSSGKTTTKNLVAAVLAKASSVVSTLGNQNNELGVPATLLRAHKDTQAVVVEMGMRGLGQIASMCAYVRPQMSLITNVGTSHIELLGSRENIARAKSEIFAALPDTGTAFLNASGEFSRKIFDATIEPRHLDCIWFDGSGEDPHHTVAGVSASIYAREITFDDAGCATFVLHIPSGEASCTLRLPGAHNVQNACAAAAVGYKFGLSAPVLAQALASVTPMAGRDRSIQTPEGITVIDDSYNANPDSMRASLATFAKREVPGRKIAVLGDMAELGDYAPRGHRHVGEYAADAHLDLLICVGKLSRSIADGAKASGMDASKIICVDDAESALTQLKSVHVKEGDAILIKASHATELDRVVKGLVER